MWNIILKREKEISLSRQLFYSIKKLILEGKITAGEALPSSRGLAKNLSVSRSTVCEAYDMLITEGFVVSRQGAPTKVKEGLYLEKYHTKAVTYETSQPSFSTDFKTGQPDVSCFPRYLWNQLLYKSCEKLQDKDLGYFTTAGYEPLREEISQWLFRTRGILAKSQDIFITTGTTQALNLFVQMLSKEGLPFAVEDPCHLGIIEILKNRKIPFLGIPVDENGIRTEQLENRDFSTVYVTPSHQFPLGGILPAERRAELIRLARKQNFYIIEDDYDSEFRYGGAPITPLYSMDCESVLYAGTFSKTMYPALRVGFVVLPPPLHAQWLHLRKYFDVQNPIIEQAALAEFLSQRKLDKYVQKICQLYGEKRQLLLKSILQCFGKEVCLLGDTSGLHLVLQIPGVCFNEGFIAKSQAFGIRVYPIEHYCIRKGNHSDKLMLGYGHLHVDEIHQSVLRLYDFIMKNSISNLL
jgi:GntR family transcriptional regulator/MocR family aminotransferase